MKRRACALVTLAAAALLVCGLGAAVAGCGKPKVKCDKLCKKMAGCAFEIMQKQGDLTQTTIKMVKKNETLRKNMKTHLRKYCDDRCSKYNKKGKWSRKDVKNIKKCVKKESCSAFAKCVTKLMY
jgi:hypothetical protein